MRAATLTTFIIVAGAIAFAAQPGIAQRAPGAEGPSTIMRWDFDTNPQGWFAGHSVAPLQVKDGSLVLNCTSDDPWIEEGPGELSIEGSEYQYIAIRAKVAESGGAEFFWEVDQKGFVAGQETGFQMTAGEFRTYTVFPLWKGRLTRLRFDPPDVEGEKVLIDYVAIMSLPPSEAPKEPVWDFSKGLQGWIPQSNVSEFSIEDGALKLVGVEGQAPVLMSPALNMEASQARFVSIRLRPIGVRRAIVYFATGEEPDFDARRFFIIPMASGRLVQYAVDTSSIAGWQGRITRLRVHFEATCCRSDVRLESAGLGETPVGPAALSVTLVRAAAVLCQGEKRRVLVRVQNVGGEPLDPGLLVGDYKYWVHEHIGPLRPGQEVDRAVWLPAGNPRLFELHARALDENAGLHVSDTRSVIVSRWPTPQPKPPAHPRALKIGENFWLANSHVAICLVRNPYGYGPAFLFRRAGAKWRRVGVLAPGVVQGAGTWSAILFPERVNIRRSGGPAALVVSGRTAYGMRGLHGRFATTLTLGSGETLEMDWSMNNAKEAWLAFFRTVTLFAGEGSFGSSFREAIFPGLEYMKSGERSSSTLDASPPHDLRYAPHPHRITIPLMAVSSKQGDVVSLMWQMPPDARKAGPAAVFASPNWLQNQDNHLMSLFLPAIPQWVGENTLRASQGMPVRAGQTLTVRASIFIGSGGVLDAVRAWFRHYGMPGLPHLARSYKEEIAFCLRSFEQVLRVPGKGWHPLLAWPPERNGRIALHYVLGEQVLGRGVPFPAMRVRGLAGARGVRDVNLAVHAGGLEEALLALRSQAYQTMASQGPDGGWGFEPNKQTKILGTPGEKEIGFTGNRVALMLNAGRMLQDRRLIEAGLRGLKFMDRFRIPRAAQVWEVPVHTPDVLASGHAVDAYLAGYLATGRKDYLKKAVYWAETGIPFHYFWQANEKGVEAMQGGGIPVFGATFFTGPWFGRIVQWCSLEYAASLLRLAPYDDTYDWRYIAEAITRSGMIQQRRESKYYGLFPDSIGMVDKEVSWGAMLNPAQICHNVFALMGKRPQANVKTVALRGGAATIICGGEVGVLRHEGSTLELSLHYEPGYASYLGITGVAAGASVRADGRLLPGGELSRLAEGARYYDQLALLVVKVQHGRRPVRLSITSLKPGKRTGARTSWDFGNSTQGWAALHDMAPLTVKAGRLLATIAGSDPFMAVGGLQADASHYCQARIVMKSPQSGLAQIFFATDGRPISEEQSKPFYVARTDDFLEYLVDMSDAPGWKGVITELRLDPLGPPGSTVEIKEISLVP